MEAPALAATVMSRMVIGALQLKLAVFGSTSLKDKRRVIKSLKDRLAGKFNVSVAEVGSLDHRQQAEVAIVLVANDRRFVESCLDTIVNYVRLDPAASLVDYESELF
ncbi:MAG TPA: DUF503 domain-containing protein [Phycisphaerae bacterium]|nr:DUF503 domain-containing protein [Phycisphaerae bacterium]